VRSAVRTPPTPTSFIGSSLTVPRPTSPEYWSLTRRPIVSISARASLSVTPGLIRPKATNECDPRD
jgi:hypothetical protein